MSKVFDFKRFQKVFVYDIERAYQNYKIPFLALVLMPVLQLLFKGLIPMIFGAGWLRPDEGARVVVFSLSLVAFLCTYSPYVYGRITEKKYGSAYLLLPASSCEKFISMLLNAVLVAPLTLIGAYLAIDVILCSVGLVEGRSVFSMILWFGTQSMSNVYVNFLGIVLMSFLMSAMTMLLGSIFFKKFKVGKTILVAWAIQLFLMLVFVFVAGKLIGSDTVFQIDGDELLFWIENHIRNFNFLANLLIDLPFIMGYLILGALIFLRLKNLKH